MMKNLCALLIAICLLSSPLLGQNNYDPDNPRPFTGGLICGLNFSQVDGDSYYGYHKVGLHAGGVVYIHFNKTVGVSMELLYTRKGSKDQSLSQSYSVGEYVATYMMKLTYVEVPITIHYSYKKYDIEGGLSYARLVNSYEYADEDPPVVINPSINYFNTSDVDFIVGASRKLFGHLYANCRYQYSLTSIRPPERIPIGYSYGNSGQYNNLFTLRLMFMF